MMGHQLVDTFYLGIFFIFFTHLNCWATTSGMIPGLTIPGLGAPAIGIAKLVISRISLGFMVDIRLLDAGYKHLLFIPYGGFQKNAYPQIVHFKRGFPLETN